MKKSLKKLTSMLLTCILVFSSVSVFAEEERNTNILANSLMDAMAAVISNTYKFGVNEADLYRDALREVIASDVTLAEIALEGMYRNLDKYSEYFDAEEFQSFVDSLSGEFCGIGVTIMEFEDGLLVTEVHKGSAAEKAGVKQGDIIVSADGVDIRGMDIDMARTHIVGVEGTEVTVGIKRGSEELTFKMVRSIVTTEPGFYQIIDGNIGYIQFSSFDAHSAEFIAEALEALKETKNIILDLRYNPGGALESLQAIAGLTLPKGPVMHLEYKDEANNKAIMNEKNGFKKKLIVLVNGYTASAAEAFAAAVQDYGVGVIVGEQTTGKGTMQIVNGVVTGGGYKLTVAEYLSPEKRTINNIGVEPDFKVKPKTVKYNEIYFEKATYDRVLKKGDTGKDVLAYEQRLSTMGFSVGVPDEVFDEDTYYAVKKYQETAGLFPYGVLDFTTQMSIENFMQDKEITIDGTLDKAREIAAGDVDAYIKEAIELRKITNR